MAKRFELAKKYTEKYKSVLNPCKCCGNTDIRIESDRSVFPSRNQWSVCCTTRACDCTSSYDKVKDAVAAWQQKTLRKEL